MSSNAHSYFHYLISYKFNNSYNHVQTAYLDTYNRNFSHGSTVDTYTIHKKVFTQFYNSFAKYQLILSTRKFNNDRKFEVFLKLNKYPAQMLFSYYDFIKQVLDILVDFDKYNPDGDTLIKFYITPILRHYNNFVNDAQKYIIPVYHHTRNTIISLPDVQPYHTILTREYHKPMPQLYSKFESAYMPGKGSGYLYTDFDFDGNYRWRHFEPY